MEAKGEGAAGDRRGQGEGKEEEWSTLDPQDWNQFRSLAHKMVDDSLEYLRTVRERPVWRSMPDETRDVLSTRQPVPFQGIGEEETYSQFVQHVMPYPNGNIHPRFWGWVQGTGTPLAVMADMLAATMNPHMAGYDQGPALVEKQVVNWLLQLFDFPTSTSSGTLTAGIP